MTVCSFCETINVSTLPTFAGFSKTIWPKDLHKVEAQEHHSSLGALRDSAQTCPGCLLLLTGLTSQERKGPIPQGLSIKHIGASEYATDWWDESVNDEPVALRGLGRDGFTAERKLMYGLLAQCGAALHKFSVFANGDSLAAHSRMVVGRKPAPVGCSKRILEWARTCNEKHVKCSAYQQIISNTRTFPTRVLDVDVGSLEQVRVVPGAGLVGKYIALSHCWGKTPMVRTTKETYSQFTKEIHISCLNKTFQDAIMVTRNLDIRYIWIDSLCIIQDDLSDWEREAASMAQVYSQAYLTIAASAASDGTQGLMRQKPKEAYFELPYDPQENPFNQGVSIAPYLLRFRRLIAAPLNTRAWTLQERVLSARTLHYARDQVHWECREAIASEAGGPPFGELLDSSGDESFHSGWLGRISEDLLSKSDTENLELAVQQRESGRSGFETWYGLIQTYTQRNLTNITDKLPALSGIARAYAQHHDSDYMAGLWLRDIGTGLLWYRRTSEPLQRPTTYIAPSWSWASVEGSMDFFSISAGTIFERSIEIYDVAYRIEPDGLNPFGKIRYGELTMWAAVKPAILKTIWEDGEPIDGKSSTQMVFDDISAIGSATLDCPTPDSEVTCLLVATGYNSFGMRLQNNLVLRLSPQKSSGENGDIFRRIGMSVFHEKRDYAPDRSLNPTMASSNYSGKMPGEVDEDFLENWFYDVEMTKLTLI
ncbi:heterokaryon incompatibility protein-domain-containing protein [Hypoxylon trugodes]|uniref:heterokaryon incompatibility protein-domain-containing protein n=1 Tax=Hypoxylon trugodes TaxID=326681 RepID=UPI00219A152B|nr:heterokaryon incompatibility protein-domain-containing protein [Hypoxylon trugodes]KAI1383430.1 heterokaryon incompatibility protein-domain-containing protein [Hypoxylon trugodes]